ncbi:MAG: transcription elongation factor Spt5 [Candidatus Thorarchaeota archaeon]|jgi:transcriptional antiterminator NusG
MSGKQSRLYAIKTSGSREKTVASFIYTRAILRKKPIYSLMVFDDLKGYVFLEAAKAQAVGETVAGFKHVRSQIPGVIQFRDIEKFLVTKSLISQVDVNDIVEVIAGPFKGMKARIDRIETSKSEVTIILLDVSYQLPVTVDANYLKIIEKAKG